MGSGKDCQVYPGFQGMCTFLCVYIKRHVYPGNQGTHGKLN